MPSLSVHEFMRQPPMAPRRRTSKMEPFAEGLELMRAKGYKLEQMQEFLAANEVKVGIQAISSFLSQRRRARERAQVSSSSRGRTAAQARAVHAEAG